MKGLAKWACGCVLYSTSLKTVHESTLQNTTRSPYSADMFSNNENCSIRNTYVYLL